MKSLFLALMLFSSFGALANLEEGVYKGKIGRKTNARLYIQDYPGRVGSYLGIIMSENEVTHFYLIDPRDEDGNKYGMVPINAMKNAVIGMESAIPSLSLSKTYRKSRRIIRITPNGSQDGKVKNTRGFRAEMSFDLDREISKRSLLVPSIPGSYKVHSSGVHSSLKRTYKRMEATVSMQGRTTHQSGLQFDRAGKLAGDYVLREVRPSLHLPLRSYMTESIEKVAQDSGFVTFFLQRRSLFGTGNYMVLVKADGSGQTITLKQR